MWQGKVNREKGEVHAWAVNTERKSGVKRVSREESEQTPKGGEHQLGMRSL